MLSKFSVDFIPNSIHRRSVDPQCSSLVGAHK